MAQTACTSDTQGVRVQRDQRRRIPQRTHARSGTRKADSRRVGTVRLRVSVTRKYRSQVGFVLRRVAAGEVIQIFLKITCNVSGKYWVKVNLKQEVLEQNFGFGKFEFENESY